MDLLCSSITGVDLQPFLVFRVLEVLQSAFRAGHIQAADYTSFLVTLLSRFEVYPGTLINLFMQLTFFFHVLFYFQWYYRKFLLHFVMLHYFAEKVCPAIKYDGKSNRKTFKQVTSIICTCLSQLGDDSLVMEMLEKIIVDHIVCSHHKCPCLSVIT